MIVEEEYSKREEYSLQSDIYKGIAYLGKKETKVFDSDRVCEMLRYIRSKMYEGEIDAWLEEKEEEIDKIKLI